MGGLGVHGGCSTCRFKAGNDEQRWRCLDLGTRQLIVSVRRRGDHTPRHGAALLVVLMLAAASCSGDETESGTSPTTTESAASPTTTESEPSSNSDGAQATSLWQQDVCTLLADDEVAAIGGGLTPTEAQPAAQGTVAADDYGGSSCRWKLSVSQFHTLDVYPSAEGQLDELAAYDPQDTWTFEEYAGIGDDARIVIATGASGLETGGTIQALVVKDGDIGLRLALTDKYPASPDDLVATAELILAQR